MNELVSDFAASLWEATQTLFPIILFFFVFQVLYLRLPLKIIGRAMMGLLLSLLGLSLFLFGVEYGFLPAGHLMGVTMGGLPYRWILVPIGFLLGFVSTLAEPAVRILGYEVDKASSGSIREKVVLYSLALGVSLAVALGMARIIIGVPIHYFLLPGYLIILLTMRYVSSTFIAIAFDSGGVVTGPMITTFVVAITLGAAETIEGRSPITDGFGLIALVAMVPILVIMILGVFFNRNDE